MTAIIDPTAGARNRVTTQRPAAVTVPTLRGLRIGLLNNTKRNAAEVLDAVGAELAAAHGTGPLVRRTKEQFAMPMPEELLDELTSCCDAVVIGVGDCGSCSASAVADGIALEHAGLPAAVVCTDAFEPTARAMARVKGDPEYRFLVTEHPVANLDQNQIEQRAVELTERVAARLLGRDRPAEAVA